MIRPKYLISFNANWHFSTLSFQSRLAGVPCRVQADIVFPVERNLGLRCRLNMHIFQGDRRM